MPDVQPNKYPYINVHVLIRFSILQTEIAFAAYSTESQSFCTVFGLQRLFLSITV